MQVSAVLNQNSFDVRWCALRRPVAGDAPYTLRKWLLDKGSLTQHLVRASQGDFRVEVMRQAWSRPTRSEALALGIPPREICLIREVQLIGRAEPWVYARSIIPVTTLTGRQRRLKALGNRSLGTVMFRDPSMRRGPLQVSKLRLGNNESVWARRSVFHLANKPLLVAEVFLKGSDPFSGTSARPND